MRGDDIISYRYVRKRFHEFPLVRAFNFYVALKRHQHHRGVWLAALINDKGYSRVVEVGVWLGETSKILLENTRAELVLVDPYRSGDGYEEGQLYGGGDQRLLDEVCHHVRKSLHDLRVCFVRESSIDAARIVKGKFDVVFIDGLHTYEAVKEDIYAWLPLVRKGGVLAGHDYNTRFPGVIRAVNERFGSHVRFGPDSVWYVEV